MAELPRGLFVTGTDTGVGKTVVAAAVLAALRARGSVVRALKPLLTGLDDPADPMWPADHELLARASGQEPERVSMLTYGPAVSPHLAAALAGEPVRPRRLAREVLAAARDGEVLVVEGVGGLLVPIAPGYDVRALAQAVGLPLLVVARPGLGTINHTLLTLEAARRKGLAVAGVVLTPWPAEPDTIAISNRTTIEELGGVTVSVLPVVSVPEPEQLAAAGAGLPLDRWLG